MASIRKGQRAVVGAIPARKASPPSAEASISNEMPRPGLSRAKGRYSGATGAWLSITARGTLFDALFARYEKRDHPFKSEGLMSRVTASARCEAIGPQDSANTLTFSLNLIKILNNIMTIFFSE